MTEGEYASARRWRDAGLTAILAIALLATVLVFTPAVIYTGNTDEFSVSLAAILQTLIVPGAGLALLCAVAGGLLPAGASRRLRVLLAVLTLLFWLQATFLVWDYGVLDGSPISWTQSAWRGVLDTTLWTAGILLAIYGSAATARLIVRAAFAAVAIQAVSVGLSVDEPGVHPPLSAGTRFDEAAYEAMFEFSASTNVLQIVMDGFQSDVFADILADPGASALRDALEGFTFFDQHTGTYPYTQMTMPLLVSGRVYRNEAPVAAFTRDVMQGPTTLNAAAAAGFDIDIASQPALARVYAAGRHSNVYPIPLTLHTSVADYVVGDTARLVDLALFRAAPHFVKAYIYRDELWFIQQIARDDAYLNLRYFAEIEFLERLADNMTLGRDRPVFKLLHLMLSHRPTAGTADCRFDGIKPTSRFHVTEQSQCALARAVAVLERMKELGIYDDAIIVLMADHGAWVGPRGYDWNATADDGPRASTAGMAVPLLAIKPRGAGGRLAVSHAPSNIGDVPATLADLLGFDHTLPGVNVFDLQEKELRTRRFYDYAYGDNHKAPGYLYTMLEYEIRGNPFDAGSWQKGRRYLAGGRSE